MKQILRFLTLGAVILSAASCKKYLDVNTPNPNSATSGTPDLVLPQSIIEVANQTFAYNFYGSQTVGYLANGGGVSGWGAIISYNYATTDQQGLWNNTYDFANDIQYVINNTEGNAQFAQYNAAAKVLKAYAFQRLVDQYGDVPYTDAFKGIDNVTPKYDDAAAVYKALADLCDNAIATFKANPTATALFRTSDPLFNSASSTTTEITRWIQFANTLKLRLIVRASASGKVSFTNTTFDAAGFLTDDAIVQPGYQKISGKQNPTYNSFAYSFAGAVIASGPQYAPTPYIVSFYNGTKLTDPNRALVTYKAVTTTTLAASTAAARYPIATNQLGNLSASAGRGASPNSWFKGTSSTAYEQQGIFKGPDAGQPLFLAADSYFLQAEAALRGIIAGTPQTLFNSGIAASFTYLYKNAAGVVLSGKTPAADATAYQALNGTSYLANYNLATTNAQRLEAIITQKYIALNFLFGDEAWNEYRRTGYPLNGNVDQVAATQTFTSIASEATSTDPLAFKVPTRLLYPNTEFVYNAGNVKTVDKYSTKIFWAR